MNRFFTLLLAASCLTAVGQGANLCEYPELLVPRVVFLDADSDGVWLYAQSDDPLIWDSGPTGDSLFVQECGTYDVRELVEIEGLGQLPCGFSEEVLVLTEDCLGSELEFFCGDGTVYDVESGKCIVANPSDSNFDGCVQLNDLLDLLSAYGNCGSEESPWQCGDTLEYQGYDYETVQIGEQCWFSENCRHLPEVSLSSEGSQTDPYYYVYGYEGSTVAEAKATDSFDAYGVLYNWPAVMTEGICPTSWHTPSDEEWQTMEISLGMTEPEAALIGWRGSPVGEDIKSSSGWNSGGNGSNSSGFNGLPVGARYNGDFDYNGRIGFWWSSSASGSDSWRRELYYNRSSVYRNYDNLNLGYGYSARCIKD